MGTRRAGRLFSYAVCIAFGLTLTAHSAAGGEHDRLITGKAAMNDWTSDAPGVQRKITAGDLPAAG